MLASTSEPIATSDDLFLMANIPSRRTGLPFIVWVSTGQGVQHDIRVKVSRGKRVRPDEFISVAIRPLLRVVHGELSSEELELLSTWVSLNLDTIQAYWSEDLDTDEMLDRIKPVG